MVRIFNTYGRGMRADDDRMVPTFCRHALCGEPLTVSGAGTQIRSLCYVDDTVAGLIALARSDFNGPVNVGNPTELSVLEVAELVRALADSDSTIEFGPPAVDDPRRRCPDITLAEQDAAVVSDDARPLAAGPGPRAAGDIAGPVRIRGPGRRTCRTCRGWPCWSPTAGW